MATSVFSKAKEAAKGFDRQAFEDELALSLVHCGLEPGNPLYVAIQKMVADDVTWLIESFEANDPGTP